MDQKTGGIIATIIATLLCGCPGLFSLCMTGLMLIAGFSQESGLAIEEALIAGGIFACTGVLLVTVPIVVGFFSLRSRRPAAVEVIDIDEPIPPAI